MLGTLKRWSFAAAARTRVLDRVAASAWRGRRLAILCYHGVALDDEHRWNGELFVTAERLRARFALLRDEGYAVLPLEEGWRRLREGTLPPRAVAITFDDGAYNFHARALPTLREFGFPATLYVTTYYTRVQLPVFPPALSYLAWKGRPGGEAAAEAARLAADALAAGVDARCKDGIARAFAARLGVDYDAVAARRVMHLMTPAETAEVAAAGIDVQLHTHRHRVPFDRDAFLREIEENREALRDALGDGAALRHFCYPNGEHARRFHPWLREAGIATATTCDPGLAGPGTHPLRLPRLVDTMYHPPEVFRASVAGLAEFLPRRTRRAAAAHD